ncbi:PD-(D/E)XK nuclease family protein [bacterium]|nr:PD-(D/E)XK nuclease family protein [bacterium]MBU1958127.1 PD-(D/E)XK nuclease family protein [bacterium]
MKNLKTLHIYPTSRAIRNMREQQKEHNALLPTLMRIDDFERRAILLPNLVMVDPLQRTLLLQEAARFDAFDGLKINRDLVRFFTKSDAIFKFFEELSHEEVSFDDLVEGDAYVEFSEHIEILEQLLTKYKHLLASKGLTDRVFIPKSYRLNRGFVEGYDEFELHLEGYMSYFELGLIAQVAEHRPFIIHMQTSKFNKKVQERFLEMGIELDNDAFVSFDLHTKMVCSSLKDEEKIEASVYAVEERLAQIPLLLESVQQMVNSGIPPEEIVVLLPDENFKESVRLYDKLNNFNFAMGFDYNKTKSYKRFEAIYNHWQSFSDETQFLLKKYNIEQERVGEMNPLKEVNVETFFTLMEPFDLDTKRAVVEEALTQFKSIFSSELMSLKSWLFLWLKRLGQLSLDDVRGGKVTVMGALETRGVAFKGVVVVDFNDGIVPSIPAKDSFLNSSLRKFAKLPTKNDREALQKQLYKRILEQAETATIIYSRSNNKAPASYLYELGLGLGEYVMPGLELLYDEPNMVIEQIDPIIEKFDARTITWSASRLKTFLTCKRKYYYHYEEQLKAKEDEELNEGAFLHMLLDHLFREHNFYKSAEEMKSNIDRLLDQLLETSSPKIAYLKLLWKAKLMKFIEQQIVHFKAGWRVVEREKEIIGSIGGINFKGRIDRIDQDVAGTMVIDYKSGSITEANRINNLEKLTDFQMSIYFELLKDNYKGLNLAFIEIFNGKMSEITELEEKTERLHETIGALKSMNRIVAERCEDVSRCTYCDYTLLCERGVYL